jgi:hypothetical protein
MSMPFAAAAFFSSLCDVLVLPIESSFLPLRGDQAMHIRYLFDINIISDSPACVKRFFKKTAGARPTVRK